MKITPKLTEQVTEVSAKIKNAVKEELSKSEIQEEVSELPRMSLESVMPKGSIIRKSVEKFDVKKAIEEFHDIHDTKTIEKICAEWNKDLDRMVEKFSSGEIHPAKVYDEHRKSIDGLEQYNTFAEKVIEMATNSGEVDAASKIFEKYIEPSIMRTQETMHKVDNLPSVHSAYQFASEKASATQVQIQKISKDEIEAVTDLNEASKLVTKLEKNKNNITQEDYDTLTEIITQRIEDIASGKVKPTTVHTTQTMKSVSELPSIDTKLLSAKIERLVAEDLVRGTVGEINNALTLLASTDKSAYAKLSEKFNAKLVELSS